MGPYILTGHTVNLKAGKNKVLGKTDLLDLNRELDFFNIFHYTLIHCWNANEDSSKNEDNT